MYRHPISRCPRLQLICASPLVHWTTCASVALAQYMASTVDVCAIIAAISTTGPISLGDEPPPRRRHRSNRSRRKLCVSARTTPLCLALGALLLIACGAPARHSPLVAYNVSASTPLGLYLVSPRAPRLGEVAAFRLSPNMSKMAQSRGYLPSRAIVLKPVAALGGDRVCRVQTAVSINGVTRTRATDYDAAGRPMPSWRGCRRLREHEIFVLSNALSSFDGRYFGVLDGRLVVGTAMPIWTIGK